MFIFKKYFRIFFTNYMKYYTTFKSVPPRYNWNIVESGVKYHNPNHINMCENEQLTIICSYRIKKRMQFCCLPCIDKEKSDGKVRRVTLYGIGNYKVFGLFCLRWRKLTFLKKKISLNILKTQMPLFHVLAADQAFLVGPPLPSIWIPLSQSLLPWEQPTRNVLCVYQLGVQFVSIYITL